MSIHLNRETVGRVCLCLIWLWLCPPSFGQSVGGESDLEKGFREPPDAAKPWVYWWWLEGNVTQEGITKDLEEMKRQGINGVLIFNAGGPAGPMPKGVRFLSPEWHVLFKHALREASRLRMEVSMNLCDGWDCGGAWIKPDEANKKWVYAEAQVEGPRSCALVLPRPEVIDGYYHDVSVIAFRERLDRPATPARITASSNTEGYCGEWNYPPQDAADSDPETFWQAGNIAPSSQRAAWLTLEYSEPVAATAVYVAPAADNGPRDCELQYAREGAYTTLCRFTLDKGQSKQIQFEETKAKQFRLLITSAYGTPVRVAEVAVLQKGEAPRLRPGIKWWWFKSANRSFWDWPRQGPIVMQPVPAADNVMPDCHAEDVVDLTRQMDANGQLTWQAPAGQWTILRGGYTLLGQRTRAACADGPIGYEADMLGSAGIESQFKNVAEPILADVAEVAGNALKYFHIDSYELGADVRGQQPTWAADFRAEFKSRRGYDLLPYLPALARRIVCNHEVTERFLWDFRRTIGDLMAERFWKRFTDLAHARGVGAHMETGYGTYPYPHIDGLQCAGLSDVPMGEFWHGTDIMSQFNSWGNVIRSVASAAHIYGHRLVQAEAFTSWNHWMESPQTLKPVGDEAFCDGLNRMVFHQYTHQPILDMKPGWQYGAGTHFDRNITWWEESHAFFQYLARCQYLLQQGRYVADAAYYYGEGVTTFVPSKAYLKPTLPKGYDFDGLNTETLLNRLSVKDGRLCLPDGLSYRLLVLPEDARLSPAVLRKLKQLVNAGATVIGPKPARTPGLTDYPRDDGAVKQLADQIWGPCDGQKVQQNRYGHGRIYWGNPLEQVLTDLGVPPDFEEASNPALPVGLEGAMWIWHPLEGDNPPPGERTFRTEFDLPAGRKVVSAGVSITADNAFELTINGMEVCRGDNFHQRYDADLIHGLRAGKNTVRIRAVNGGTSPNPAGLIARLEVRLEQGAPLAWATGSQPWFSTQDGQHWEPVRVVGPYGCQPWGLPAAPHVSLNYIHRTIGAAECYLVCNPSARFVHSTCLFRVTDKQPEFWDPIRGGIRDATDYRQENGRTAVPLELAPGGSLFVVFRKPPAPQAGGTTRRNFPAYSFRQEITGSWQVRFDPHWGGPEVAAFDQLISWTRRPEPGIKYYSGKATYATTFNLSETFNQPGRRILLDLGVVKHLAQVWLNGQKLEVLWTDPFSVDITSAVKPQDNILAIDVINLWPNRVIGDAGLPPEKRWTHTNVSFGKNTPLLDSGLLGPVTLRAEE